MATRKSSSSSSGIGKLFLGIILGVLLVAVGGFLYLRYAALPVAVTDKPFYLEAQIVHVPMNARIAREKKDPPFGTSEDVFESGAKIYQQQCAMCHGTPGHDAAIAKHMYPSIPQLWAKHKGGTVGVSDDDASETYWKVANGIRLTGMPSYNHILSDTQMWQVSLLLKNADQPLPDPVMKLINQP